MFIQGLGDIVALVQLATFVVQKLNDAATKAPKQVKDLIDDASRLKRMLTNMKTIIDSQGAALKPHDEIKQDMLQVLIRCGEMVEGLKHIATSYESIAAKEVEGTGSESRAKQWLTAMNNPQGLYRRVKWTTVDTAVKDLRGLLQQHMQALQLIMQFLATRQMTELQWGVSRILQLMENHPGKVDQNFRSLPFTIPSGSPTSSAIDSGTQSPTTGTPFLSPLIPSQSTSLFGFSPDLRKSPATSPPFEDTGEQPASQHLEPLELPDPIIDPFSFVFPHNLPLNLDLDFPISAFEENFPYAGPASKVEHDEFVGNLIARREHVKIPVESVNFVFQKSPASERAVINASDVGELLLLKTGSGENAAVTDIWTLNAARTVRVRQKVPVWDVIVPYSPHGDKMSAVISQGFGLSFVILEKGHRETHSIPTTWVTYNFSLIEDCKTFQKLLYGWDLLHTIPVKEIYLAHTFSSDELLAARENVRIWKDPNGPEIQFMAHLQMKEGRKKYLQFDLGQESIKPVSERDLTLHLEGIKALVDDPLYMKQRKRSTTSLSSTSTTSSRRSVFRRFSADRSPHLDRITVGFSDHKDRDELLKVVLNSHPTCS